jgi:hypothetical protein
MKPRVATPEPSREETRGVGTASLAMESRLKPTEKRDNPFQRFFNR